MNYCYTTLLASDDYLYGALGLYFSLQEVEAKYPLHIIITDNISQENIAIIQSLGIKYTIVPRIDFICSGSQYNITFNKFYIFSLKDYDKVCFIDADAIVQRNIDDLFKIDTPAFTKFDPSSRFLSGVLILVNPNEYDIKFFQKQYLTDFIGDDETVWNNLYLYEKVFDLSLYFEDLLHHSDFGHTSTKYWKYFSLNSTDAIKTFIHEQSLRGYEELHYLFQMNEQEFGVPEIPDLE